jgi:hypothetical protein
MKDSLAIVESGPKWKKKRHLANPAFNISDPSFYINTFNKHCKTTFTGVKGEADIS